MKNNRRIFIGFYMLMCSIITTNACSQTESENQKKYWFYRNRFTNYFVQVGPDFGESLPFAGRCNVIGSSPGVIAADNTDTPNYLGYYIMSLATEYKLLNDAGQDVSQTARELFFAIDAFNRLDWIGDTIFYPGPNQLDGYYFMSDYPSNFIQNHPKLNEGTVSLNQSYNFNGNQVTTDVCEISQTNSRWGYESTLPTFDKNLNELYPHSQDMCINFMFGLSAVSKFVPNSANLPGHTFMDGETNFVEEARNITKRLTNRFINEDWMLKEPDGTNLANHYGIAVQWSSGIAQAARFICNDQSLFWDPISSRPDVFNIWQQLQDISNVSVYTALTSGWDSPLFSSMLWNSSQVLELAVMANNWMYPSSIINSTLFKIEQIATLFDWSPFYLSLYKLYHGGAFIYSQNQLKEILDSAPCDGMNNAEPDGWRSSFRWRMSVDEQNSGEGAPSHTGLDYMIMYNLYRLLFQDDEFLPDYINMMNGDEAANAYPTTEFIVQSSMLKKTVGANPVSGVNAIVVPEVVNSFGSINSSAHVEGGDYIIFDNVDENLQVPVVASLHANVTFRAGGEIILEPGFEVGSDADFLAYIDPYECNSSGTEYLRMAGSSDGTDNSNGASSIETKKQDQNGELEGNMFSLLPNPSAGNTRLQFTLSETSSTNITVTNIYGQTIKEFVNEPQEAGIHENILEGDLLSPGIYFCTFTSTSSTGIKKEETKKLVVLR